MPATLTTERGSFQKAASALALGWMGSLRVEDATQLNYYPPGAVPTKYRPTNWKGKVVNTSQPLSLQRQPT